MGSVWPEEELGDVADDVTVGHVGSMATEYLPSGIPFLRSLNVAPHRIEMADMKFVSADFHGKLKKSALRPGDVVIVRTGKPGTAAVIPPNLHVANCSDLVVVRPGPKLDPRFLAYFINSQAQGHVDAHTVGAVQQHFNIGSARQMKVPTPLLAEQRAIAGVLGALDDKIEANRRMNATLEALARALFKSWFVDFDPVYANMGRAKMARSAEGATNPEIARPPAMAPTLDGSGIACDAGGLAALFPARLTDSPLGPIPEGWEVKGLSEIARFLNGLALQKYPPDGDDFIPVIKIAELRAGEWSSGDRASTDIPSDYIVEDGDLLFSWSGSLIHRLWAGGRGALNQHLFKVTSQAVPRWYMFQAIDLHMPEFRDIAADKATTMGHIQRKHLDQALITLPPPPLLKAAGNVVGALESRILTAKLQSRTLAQLRDLLLPKLLSGALRVRDAEKMVEDAA